MANRAYIENEKCDGFLYRGKPFVNKVDIYVNTFFITRNCKFLLTNSIYLDIKKLHHYEYGVFLLFVQYI